MRVAVTGATSPLGQAILRRLPNPLPIGHKMTSEPAALLIHAAAPDARDEDAVARFRGFNLAVAEWVDRWKPVVVNVGSWWQVSTGPAAETSYVAEKRWQAEHLREARTVLPYSIYGPSKGFPMDLVRHLTGQRRMSFLSGQPRDFIHVDDVADACIRAADRFPGEYAACSGEPLRPSLLGYRFGAHLHLYDPPPVAHLAYSALNIATPSIHVADWIGRELGTHVKRLTSQET